MLIQLSLISIDVTKFDNYDTNSSKIKNVSLFGLQQIHVNSVQFNYNANIAKFANYKTNSALQKASVVFQLKSDKC